MARAYQFPHSKKIRAKGDRTAIVSRASAQTTAQAQWRPGKASAYIMPNVMPFEKWYDHPSTSVNREELSASASQTPNAVMGVKTRCPARWNGIRLTS